MSEKKLFETFPPVSIDEWEQVIKKDLKGADYKQKLNWKTGEGIEALPFYRRENRPQTDGPLLPAGHHCSIRQTIYEQNIEEANQSAIKAIEGGADALTFSIKLKSTKGALGPDMEGTAIQSQQDFNKLLRDISLTRTALHFNCGMVSPVFIAMLSNECEKQQIDTAKVQGSFLFDPFRFMLQHGRLPENEEKMADTIQQMIAFCAKHLPKLKPLGIDAAICHNAGATLVQELGFALAAGSEYLALLSEQKIDPETVAKAIHFNFSVGSTYFPEIAKFRAARKLWLKILQAYDISDTAMMIHAETALWNKTQREPYTNMLRDTTEGMAAALGGCDSITVTPFDSVFRQPDEFSQRIARNTQLILKHEAYFDKVSDPAAGSWYIETLTDKIAEAAWNTFKEIEQQGGLLKSIKEGTIQTMIEESRKKKHEAIYARKKIFAGTNKYVNGLESVDESNAPAGHKTVSMKQTEDGATIDPKNLLPSIKEALNSGAAIGDLAPALFDMSNLQIKPLHKYRAEIIENDK